MDLDNLSEKEVAVLAARMFLSRGYDAEVGVYSRGESDLTYKVDIYLEKPSWFGFRKGYSQLVEVETDEVGKDSLEKYLIKFKDISARLKLDKLTIITTSNFTEDAREYAESHDIGLIDGVSLQEQLTATSLLY